MKKTLLIERFQKLAGIKPLYGNLNEIGDEKLSPESSEWLKDQINMYFDGGDELEPGGRGEFEITRMEQGDPKKYQDAQSAQKFLDELKVIKSVVVRFDDYIGDILVLSDREGDALVSWTNPKDNQDLSEDYSEGNESLGFVELMDVEGPIEEIINAFDTWKEGPMTEPEDIIPAKRDLINYISRRIEFYY